MSLVAAARVGHQVNHTSAFAGFIAGAIIGGVVALGIAATVATGGLAAPAAIAAVSIGVGIGSFAGEMIGKHVIPGSPKGPIIRGSPNVFINGMNAAYCSSDVACSKHGTQKVAQGSATVGYNQLPAARKGDKGTCGFAIGEGSDNVFIGGEMGGCGLPVGDEVPWWARGAVLVIGLAGGVVGMARAGICALGIVARLGAGIVIGGAGSYAGSMLGGRLFGEGSFGQDLFGFLGGEAFSRLAMRGPFGRWMVGEPIDVVSGEVVVGQTDFELPGALPLELRRFYSSGLIYDSSFGKKWASTWGQFITTDETYAYFHSDDGRRLPFDLLEKGEEVRHIYANKFRLKRTENGFAVRDEENRTRYFENKFGERLLISAIEDLNGYRIDFEYDEDGALREVRHSGGYRLKVEATAEAVRRVELVGEDGSREELVSYDYKEGLLSAVYNSSGKPLRFEYDDEARLTKWEDRRGTWFTYEYDQTGRCIRTRGSNGMYSGSLRYNDETLTNSYTDSLGNTTHYTYNLEFQVVKTIDPRGGIDLCEYDERDNLISHTDPFNNKTEYFYDADGNLIRQVNALGAATGANYNDLHLPKMITDASGSTVRREYDEKGNLTKLIEPNGNEYIYERDKRGNALKIINALGDECEFEYDAKGLLISATDWKGNKTVLRRNFKDLVSEKIDPPGNRTKYEYEFIDKISKILLPDNSEITWKYNDEGCITEHKDAGGRIFRCDYGAFDLLTSERLPNNARRRYRYDTEARLIAVENELGEVYRYTYDSTGNIISEEDFAGRVLHFEYDLAGRCIKKINGAGQIITFEYDALGQVVKQINADGEEAIYEYDDVGRVVRTVSSDGIEVSFKRNELGQIISENQFGQAVKSEFDQLGRRISRRTVRGNEINWSYNANGLPNEMLFENGESFLFEYDKLSRETSRKLSGGLHLERRYDMLDRLIRQSVKLNTNGDPQYLASNLSEQKYTYDENGNPLASQDNIRGKLRYEYNLLGRITTVERDFTQAENYEYDLAGNITRAVNVLREMQNTAWQGIREIARGNRLLQAGRISYEYDTDGRVVEKSVVAGGKIERWKFQWTSEGRLRSVVNPKGEKWLYRYDAFGRRVEKIGRNGTTRYIWDGMVVAVVISPDDKATEWTFEDFSFCPLAKIEDGAIFISVNDQSGRPLELFGQNGKKAWQLQTNVWSVPVSEREKQTACEIRFQGQWYDAESGLHYNFHRYYDPETGRYLSSDPIGLDGGFNNYSYAINPLSWADPLGLMNCSQFRTPYRPLTFRQRRAIQGRINSRTATRQDYNRLNWDRRFSNRRSRGVNRFWAQERRALQSGQPGTRNWTPQQRADILAGRTPRHNGRPIEGHHRYNAIDHPQIADDPNNIYPATWDEHFNRWHGGNFQNDTFGVPRNPGFPEEF